jgi:hypothetical protein
MQEPNKDQTHTITLGTKLILFGAIFLGLLAIVIGESQTRSNLTWMIWTGRFLLPFALFGGGFYLKEENNAMRITLMVLGAVMVVYGLFGTSIMSAVSGY